MLMFDEPSESAFWPGAAAIHTAAPVSAYNTTPLLSATRLYSDACKQPAFRMPPVLERSARTRLLLFLLNPLVAVAMRVS